MTEKLSDKACSPQDLCCSMTSTRSAIKKPARCMGCGNSTEILPGPDSTSSSEMDIPAGASQEPPKSDTSEGTYWPVDLLTKACPNTRVMVWGCQNMVMNGKLLRYQKSIFAHAEGLLRELSEFRDESHTTGRRVAFLAHSLGGLVLKEALRRAASEPQFHAKDLLYSTSTVVFMASPHRVSAAWSLVDVAKNMAHLTLGVDPRDPNMSSLFTACTDATEMPTMPRCAGVDADMEEKLELGRKAFLSLWDDHNFRVKTFQEQGPTDEHHEDIQVDLRLRREATLFCLPEEEAETATGGHLTMAQFRSAEDPTWKNLSNVFQRAVQLEQNRLHELTQSEQECLRALEMGTWSPNESDTFRSFHPGACIWLYNIPGFREWYHRRQNGKGRLLWIKGPAGSGKTVLLKSLRRRLEKRWTPSSAAVFVDVAADGQDDIDSVYFSPSRQKQRHGPTPNPVGAYRSLLSQLYLHDPKLREQIMALYQDENRLEDERIMSYFVETYMESRIEIPPKRTFILVHAAHTCGARYVRSLVVHLSRLASMSSFTIAVTSGEQAEITDLRLPPGAPQPLVVHLHHHNGKEIIRHISLNLRGEWQGRKKTIQRVAGKAQGIFLWVEMVVKILNAAVEEGAMPTVAEYILELIPPSLEGLYEWLLSTLSNREKEEALTLFRWVLFASEPLRVNDLCFAIGTGKTRLCGDASKVAFCLGPAGWIRDLQWPEKSVAGSPVKFHYWLRERSLGLLELRPRAVAHGGVEPVGMQRVHVIHESVRAFFLDGKGYEVLAGKDAAKVDRFEDISHCLLLNACLRYLDVKDFERLEHTTRAAYIHAPPGTHFRLGGDCVSSPATLSNFRSSPSQASGSESRSQSVAKSQTPSNSRSWPQALSENSQGHPIMGSCPFLNYAVSNILYHLLSPRSWRYFLPHRELLAVLGRNSCRLWRRWTVLLGTNEPSEVLRLSESAAHLLGATSGASVRLERIFRRLNRLAIAEPDPEEKKQSSI